MRLNVQLWLRLASSALPCGLFLLVTATLCAQNRVPLVRGAAALPGHESTLRNDVPVIREAGPALSPAKGRCTLAPFQAAKGVVSSTTLGMPANAEREYARACTAIDKGRPDEAEKHVREAVRLYPVDPAGWVMLGIMLNGRQQRDEARAACEHGASLDAKYARAYLCLAAIAGSERRWDDVFTQTGRALELDHYSSAYAYYFQALALYAQRRLPEAERTARAAAVADSDHHEPGIHFLLAQIASSEGSRDSAVAELREFLRFCTDAQDAAEARRDLAMLEAAK